MELVGYEDEEAGRSLRLQSWEVHVSKEYAEKIEFDNNTNEVQSLPNVLYSQCEDIVNKKGYKLLDYFIYFFNDINVLSFEIEKN